MKKTFIILIACLMTSISYCQVNQTISPFGLSPVAADWSVVGEYFEGCTYIFFPFTDPLPATNAIINRIYYNKVYLNSSDSIKFLPDPTKSQDEASYEFPFTVRNSEVIPATCVYKGRLYFFYTVANNDIKYTSTDGLTWTDPVNIEDFKATGISMSASVLGEKLCLIKQNENGNVALVHTTDLVNWTNAGRIMSSEEAENKNVSISSCTFTTSDNKAHLLISVNPKNLSILTLWYDEDNGYHNIQTVPGGALAKSAHLMHGSLNYLSITDATSDIQLLLRGTNDFLWLVQYFPDDNQWGTLINTAFLSGMSYTPGVFPLFRSGSNNKVVKRICVAEAKAPLAQSYLDVFHFDSDRIKNTDTVPNNCENLPGLWSLVGVVEGPPPFVLNGQNITELNDNTIPSIFAYGTSESNEVVNTTEWTVSTSLSASLPFADIFSAGIDLKAAVKDFVSDSYEKTYTQSTSVRPGEYPLGYYYFLKPTITRYKYERFNYNNISRNQYEYIFAVTEASLRVVEYDLVNFDPFNIESYRNKAPDAIYNRLSEKGFSWNRGTAFESEFSTNTTKEHTSGSNVTIEANFGAEDIFSVSAGYEINFEETHKTVFGESISITLDNPDPRTGVSTDVKSYAGTAYWLKSTSKNDYWIPRDLNGYDYKDHRPWLVTWDITDIQYNDATDTEEITDLPAEFVLNQNYPNPFNPSTIIRYGIPRPADYHSAEHVSLRIYDILGNLVANLQDGPQSPGYYECSWNAGNITSGIYFYILQAGDFTESKKMLLLK